MVTTGNLAVFEDMASWDDLYSVRSLESLNFDHTITHVYVPPLHFTVFVGKLMDVT